MKYALDLINLSFSFELFYSFQYLDTFFSVFIGGTGEPPKPSETEHTGAEASTDQESEKKSWIVFCMKSVP